MNAPEAKPLSIRKVLGVALLLVVGLVLVGALVYGWRVSSILRDELTAIQSDSLPISLSDFAKGSADDGENAFVVLQSLNNELPALELRLSPLAEKREAGWGPADLTTLQTMFDDSGQVLAAIREASACKTYASRIFPGQTAAQFATDRTDAASKLRTVARILNVHQGWLIAEGRGAEAVDDGIILLKLADLGEKEPTLTAYLVMLAVRSIALDGLAKSLYQTELPEDVRPRLDAQLARYDATRSFQQALASERAFGLHALREQPSLPLMKYGRDVAYLRFMQEQIAAAAKPVSAAPPVMPAAGGGGLMGAPQIGILAPLIRNARIATERTRAMNNAVRVLNAIQQHPEFGTAPSDDLLRLGLPLDAIVDPWTDKPLVIQRVGEQWAVYSIGPNGKDDGGPGKENSDDIGVAP